MLGEIDLSVSPTTTVISRARARGNKRETAALFIGTEAEERRRTLLVWSAPSLSPVARMHAIQRTACSRARMAGIDTRRRDAPRRALRRMCGSLIRRSIITQIRYAVRKDVRNARVAYVADVAPRWPFSARRTNRGKTANNGTE